MIEIKAKISSRWMRKLLTCRTKKPPSQSKTSTTARIRNMMTYFLGTDWRAGRDCTGHMSRSSANSLLRLSKIAGIKVATNATFSRLRRPCRLLPPPSKMSAKYLFENTYARTSYIKHRMKRNLRQTIPNKQVMVRLLQKESPAGSRGLFLNAVLQV